MALGGLVDSGAAWGFGWLGVVAVSVAVLGVGGGGHEGASRLDGLGLSTVHDIWCQRAEVGVAMMLVVGVEEGGGERLGFGGGGERFGELGLYFKVLDCAWL